MHILAARSGAGYVCEWTAASPFENYIHPIVGREMFILLPKLLGSITFICYYFYYGNVFKTVPKSLNDFRKKITLNSSRFIHVWFFFCIHCNFGQWLDRAGQEAVWKTQEEGYGCGGGGHGGGWCKLLVVRLRGKIPFGDPKGSSRKAV